MSAVSGLECIECLNILGGNLEDLMVALLYKPEEYDAMQLHKAIAGAGTNEKILLEIMSTRTNEEIRSIQAAYKKGRLLPDL